MGKLLEKAIFEASKLPESDQEEIGVWLLHGAVDQLADRALEEHDRGLSQALDSPAR
jgi:hypothetical protein